MLLTLVTEKRPARRKRASGGGTPEAKRTRTDSPQTPEQPVGEMVSPSDEATSDACAEEIAAESEDEASPPPRRGGRRGAGRRRGGGRKAAKTNPGESESQERDESASGSGAKKSGPQGGKCLTSTLHNHSFS